MALIKIGTNGLDTGVGGKVLQVVSNNFSYNHSTTSSSFVDVEESSGVTFTTSITPSSTSSKIFLSGVIEAHVFPFGSYTSIGSGQYSLNQSIGGASYTNIQLGKLGGYSTGNYEVLRLFGIVSFSYSSSPNTTSSIDYKYQFLNLESSNEIFSGSLTAMEIAG